MYVHDFATKELFLQGRLYIYIHTHTHTHTHTHIYICDPA